MGISTTAGGTGPWCWTAFCGASGMSSSQQAVRFEIVVNGVAEDEVFPYAWGSCTASLPKREADLIRKGGWIDHEAIASKSIPNLPDFELHGEVKSEGRPDVE